MIATHYENFKGIDFIKFIMSIVVVAIHTHPFKSSGAIIFQESWYIIMKLAVPYLFIASGFLLFSKVENANDYASQLDIIKKYGMRIFKMYIY